MYENWEQLKAECMECRKCSLCETRTNLVFGVGSENAEVMFIGEGPGENEDLQGEPFVGRGGKLLDKYLEAINLDRKKNIYIANMVKCRPPKNRDPLPDEQDCRKLLLHNRIEEIGRMSAFLDELGEELNLKPEVAFNIHLALEEAVSNVIM